MRTNKKINPDQLDTAKNALPTYTAPSLHRLSQPGSTPKIGDTENNPDWEPNQIPGGPS